MLMVATYSIFRNYIAPVLVAEVASCTMDEIWERWLLAPDSQSR